MRVLVLTVVLLSGVQAAASEPARRDLPSRSQAARRLDRERLQAALVRHGLPGLPATAAEGGHRPEIKFPWASLLRHLSAYQTEACETRAAAPQRKPVQHDIFVHVSAAGYEEQMRVEHKAYYDRILQLARAAQSAIQVNSTDDGRLEQIIPHERLIHSIPYQLEVTGKICANTAARLLHLIAPTNRADHFRVHGAFHGCCPREFAVQLYGLVYENQFWPDYPRPIWGEDRDAGLCQAQHDAILKLLEDGAFERSHIRFGTLWDHKPKTLRA